MSTFRLSICIAMNSLAMSSETVRESILIEYHIFPVPVSHLGKKVPILKEFILVAPVMFLDPATWSRDTSYYFQFQGKIGIYAWNGERLKCSAINFLKQGNKRFVESSNVDNLTPSLLCNSMPNCGKERLHCPQNGVRKAVRKSVVCNERMWALI